MHAEQFVSMDRGSMIIPFIVVYQDNMEMVYHLFSSCFENSCSSFITIAKVGIQSAKKVAKNQGIKA